ncbi:putative F-box/FBD/LRR-repeat protein At3g49030 [Triticum dicoccoides]|uniref:putative F-box/FBD/LRR-repeat protein At3g49030 n=1 Tax=Triticum dicoccoides TaxID=85692 RepID=UPI00188EE7FA|nr:putative F-box/FBD/LRR-repeat protein At3g49030 [Triticum dicoccoides]
MESPPLKLSVGRGEDRISTLPDELLRILERLDLPEVVRAGAVSTRWRHLPRQLSVLMLGIHDMPVENMDAFTGALMSVCPPADRNCECRRSRAIKALVLGFYLSAPHLSSIGSAVQDVISRGKTRCLVFQISPPPVDNNTAQQLAELGQQFMSFSRAYQVAFRWLTRLHLRSFAFGDSDITDLITACDKLKHLNMRSCRLVDRRSALKIGAPYSGLQELEFTHFGCKRIELISVPKLRTMLCHSWRSKNPPVRFGYVPELCKVSLTREAKVWQAPFLLSECLSRSATNLSKLHLNFCHQMIWINPEHPKQLTAIFRNLADVSLSGIFPECDLSWTLFILEAAPALQKFTLSRAQLCAKTAVDSAEKTNVVWEPSKDFKHLNLKKLAFQGFEEEDKVTSYIRLVMERAVGLKRIVLLGELPCQDCNDCKRKCMLGELPSKDCNDCKRKCTVDKARRHRVKEQLAHGSCSSVEIIICTLKCHH